MARGTGPADHAQTNPDTTVGEARDQTEPIVRTVGDLTARHIGQSVRVFEGPFFTLRHLSSFIRGEWDDYIGLGAEWDDDPDEWEYFETPLDTPCEVLS